MADEDPKEKELREKALQEGAKLFVEGYKVLITISTGSLVIMGAFFEKVVKPGADTYFLRGSIAGFLACAVFSTFLIMLKGQLVISRGTVRASAY